MNSTMNFSLLTIMGKVKPSSIEDTCTLHNQTAGHPEGVAGAKYLGDMSHMTYMPLDAATNFKGDLLFLDVWNNLEGLNQFFSDPQVQGGAAMMFETRDAVVWKKLDGFLHCNFPAPTGNHNRIVGIVRGKVKSIEEAEAIHNTAIANTIKAGRANGILSHEFYVRIANPGSPESLEVLGLDIWMNAEGMMKHYMSSEFQNSGLYKMFTEKPVSSTWVHPKGEWVEW
ncbi:MAG: hypothetical protein ABI761_15445 [Saprospiraceae bacterium]